MSALPFRSRLTLAAAVIVCAGSLPAASGTFGPEPYPSWKEGGLSQKLNYFTFYEESEGLKVFVGVEVARYHDAETYFPVQIAVGNNNDRSVTLTTQEFVLTDDKGVYYPLAEHQAISKEYGKTVFDQRLLQQAQFLGNKFVGFDQIPSLFYPNIAFTGVKNDQISLPKGTYLSDVLYFRKPVGPLEGRTFTLTVYFPQQERQMDVKFALPGEPRKSD